MSSVMFLIYNMYWHSADIDICLSATEALSWLAIAYIKNGHTSECKGNYRTLMICYIYALFFLTNHNIETSDIIVMQ